LVPSGFVPPMIPRQFSSNASQMIKVMTQ